MSQRPKNIPRPPVPPARPPGPGIRLVGDSPYRSLAIVDERRPARVEAAHCGWCRFHESIECLHPVQLTKGTPFRCSERNPRGECPHWEPSWWTRLLRRLRLGRAPVMVDPRVWDDKP